ncbi:MAG: DUF1624 domain-containing protein [Fidelibacterota bacterium]|nr:MAG: DUF1624 domain-containing protein [Candidatus Neomarinimicrobiota bacterium]
MNTSTRLDAIDQYRGLAAILMVIANYAVRIETLPGFLRHSSDVGLTLMDLGAPVFIFAIGLTHGLSVRRRIGRVGRGKTIEHFLRRYMALFGIGALIAYGEVLVGQSQSPVSWNVLQSIAVAGVLTLPVIHLPWRYRIGIAVALLVVYQILLEVWWLDLVRNASHGGLLGSLGWGAMLILSTALADLFHDEQRRKIYPWAILFVLLAGIGVSLPVPIAMKSVSASYVVFSIGTSGLLFWIFHRLVDQLGMRVQLFTAWGRNPLLLYLIHFLLLAVFVLPDKPGWYPYGPLWLVVVQLGMMVAVLSWIAWRLYRRDWIFSL